MKFIKQRIPIWVKDIYGSNRGFVRHLWSKGLYYLGFRFGVRVDSKVEVTRVVFVCRGNVCRSALAHVIAKDLANIEVCSFGLETHSGKPANQRMIEVSAAKGIDLTDHLTTSFEDFSRKTTDLYVCTEPWQSKALRKNLGSGNITLIGLYGQKLRPYLHDPFCANDQYVDFCISYIDQAVVNLLDSFGALK